MTTITVDPSYGYVLLCAASTGLLGQIHGLNTGKYRKAAACPYPAAYAPSTRTDRAAYQFNCAQRAHANYVENQPSFLIMLLISGLRYPVASAALGGVWVASRWAYMVGYSTGTKEAGKSRYAGGLGVAHSLVYFVLIGMSAYTSVKLVLGN